MIGSSSWSLIFCVSTKGSCVDPLGKVPEIGDLDNFGLYVDDNPSRLITLGRVYEGSTTIHNILLGNDQMKVGVQEVRDANAHILVPIQEVHLVGRALNTFLAWSTHLVKSLSE